MALNVQMYKVHNMLTDEDIVIPRLVNQQSLDFNELCEYLADGSTVTAADVSAASATGAGVEREGGVFAGGPDLPSESVGVDHAE